VTATTQTGARIDVESVVGHRVPPCVRLQLAIPLYGSQSGPELRDRSQGYTPSNTPADGRLDNDRLISWPEAPTRPRDQICRERPAGVVVVPALSLAHVCASDTLLRYFIGIGLSFAVAPGRAL